MARIFQQAVGLSRSRSDATEVSELGGFFIMVTLVLPVKM